MNLTNYAEETLLNVINLISYYVQLHDDNPGESGTANVAGTTSRQVVTFSTAFEGAASNINAIVWSTITATENITHISLWNAASGGNPYWYGALTTPVAVTAGGTLAIAIGDLTLSLD